MSYNALFSSSNSITDQPTHTFLQTLSDDQKQQNDAVYIHPLIKNSSSKLSRISLEMCTESLGSETGCDVTEDGAFSTSSSMIRKSVDARIEAKTPKRERECKYPPPLTSVSESISVECYRENGRLVANAAVFLEVSDSLFEAERVDGRLTLRFKEVDEEEDEFDDDTNGGDDEKWSGDAEHSVFL